MYNNQENQGTTITTSGSSQIFTGRGRLVAIVVNNANAGAANVILTDVGSPVVNSSNKGTIVVTTSVAATLPFYNMIFANGLTVNTSSSPSITVIWTQG